MDTQRSSSEAFDHRRCIMPRVAAAAAMWMLVLTLCSCAHIQMAMWDGEGLGEAIFDPMFDAFLGTSSDGSSGTASGGGSVSSQAAPQAAARAVEPVEVKPPDQFGSLVRGLGQARPVAFVIAGVFLGAFVLNRLVTRRSKARSQAGLGERTKGRRALRVIGSPLSALAAVVILIVVEWTAVEMWLNELLTDDPAILKGLRLDEPTLQINGCQRLKKSRPPILLAIKAMVSAGA